MGDPIAVLDKLAKKWRWLASNTDALVVALEDGGDCAWNRGISAQASECADELDAAIALMRGQSEDAKDAARWRYIRDDGLIWRATFLVSDPTNTEVYSGAKADAVVDAAIAKQEPAE